MEDITEEYLSSLEDLTFNSKPHINMLTILAEENKSFSAHIVNLIEEQLGKATTKLPILYLLDSIIKNVGENYRPLFAKNLVNTFELAFKSSDDKQKMSLYKLRSTWDDHFPLKTLYALDINIKGLDPNWPVKPLPAHLQDNLAPNIHINPKFLKKESSASDATKAKKSDAVKLKPKKVSGEVETIQQQLVRQQKELLDLQQKRLLLELEQTKQQLQAKEKEIQLIKNDKPNNLKTSNNEPQVQENFKVTVPNISSAGSQMQSVHKTKPSAPKDPRIKNANTKKVATKTTSPSKNNSVKMVAAEKLKNNPQLKKKSPTVSEKEKLMSKQENVVNKVSKTETSKHKSDTRQKEFKKTSPTDNERRKKRSFRKSAKSPPSKFSKRSLSPNYRKSTSPDIKVKRKFVKDLPERFSDSSLSPRFSPEPEVYSEGQMYQERKNFQEKPTVSRRMSVDPNLQIPQELTLSHQNEILKQADLQLHNGQLSHEQHQEMLKQLHQLFELQRDRRTFHDQGHLFGKIKTNKFSPEDNRNLASRRPTHSLNSNSHREVFDEKFEKKAFNKEFHNPLDHQFNKSRPKHDKQIKSKTNDLRSKIRGDNMDKEVPYQESNNNSKPIAKKNNLKPRNSNSKKTNFQKDKISKVFTGKKSIRRFAQDDAVFKKETNSTKNSSIISKRIPKLQKPGFDNDKVSPKKHGPEEPEDFIIAGMPPEIKSSQLEEPEDYIIAGMKKSVDSKVQQTCEEPEEFIIANMSNNTETNSGTTIEAASAYNEHIKKIQKSINSRKPDADNGSDKDDLKNKGFDATKSPPLPLKKRRYISAEKKQDYESMEVNVSENKSDLQKNKIKSNEDLEEEKGVMDPLDAETSDKVFFNEDTSIEGVANIKHDDSTHELNPNNSRDFPKKSAWPRESFPEEHLRGRQSHRGGRLRGHPGLKKGRQYRSKTSRKNEEDDQMHYIMAQENNWDDMVGINRMNEHRRRPPLLRYRGRGGWNSPPRDDPPFDIARGRLPTRRDHNFSRMQERNRRGFGPDKFYMDERRERSPPRHHFHDDKFPPDWKRGPRRRSPIGEHPPLFMPNDFSYPERESMYKPRTLPNPYPFPDFVEMEKRDNIDGYHRDNEFGMSVNPNSAFEPPAPVKPEINQIDVNQLLFNLLNKGIIPGKQTSKSPIPTERNDSPTHPPSSSEKKSDNIEITETRKSISPFNPDVVSVDPDADIPVLTFKSNLNERHSEIIKRLNTGIQCAACGLRFTTMQTDLYADHLDWHFRINKKDKEGFAQTHRTIYPTAGEWICYEEIENSQTKNVQLNELEDLDNVETEERESDNKVTLTGKQGEEYCKVCKEGFNTIYNESEEAWQFSNCVKKDDINFHPSCYEDHFQNCAIPTPVKTQLVHSSDEDFTNKIKEENNENSPGPFVGQNVTDGGIPGLNSFTEENLPEGEVKEKELEGEVKEEELEDKETEGEVKEEELEEMETSKSAKLEKKESPEESTVVENNALFNSEKKSEEEVDQEEHEINVADPEINVAEESLGVDNEKTNKEFDPVVPASNEEQVLADNLDTVVTEAQQFKSDESQAQNTANLS